MNRGIMILLIVVALFLFVGICNNSNQSEVAKASGGKTDQVQNTNDSSDSSVDMKLLESSSENVADNDNTFTGADFEESAVTALPENKVQKQVPPPMDLPKPGEDLPVRALPVKDTPEKKTNALLGYDSGDTMFLLPESNEKDSNERLKPNELLPADSVDVTNQNFLSASLTDTVKRVGAPTQINRNRKNYDLRSTPVIDKQNISPWNNSTIEPDTERRVFEIGQPEVVCPPCTK